jgi:hypothetical protein
MKLLLGFAIGYFVATTPIGQEILPTVQHYTIQFLNWITQIIGGL